MLLSLPQLKSIRAMLRAGFRHTQIARELDLAVGTISRLAGDRQLRDPEVPDEDLDLPDDDPPPGYDAKSLRRCPTCGAMVYLWPCLACHMKDQASPLPNAERAPTTGDEYGIRNEEPRSQNDHAARHSAFATAYSLFPIHPALGSAGATPSQPFTQTVRS